MSILAVISAAMVPLAPGLREPRASPSRGMIMPLGSRAALQEAFGTPEFWLLTVGFFVCGFHVTFIGLHLPAYISDNAVGMSVFGRPVSALELGGWAVGLGIAGTDIRDVSCAAIVVAVGAGIRRVARLPMARHSAADQRARRLHVRPDAPVDVWGIVFFSHQLGSFFGGWGAGRIYDLRGDYGLMWWISVGFGVFATLLHWCIREQPVPRLAIAAEAA